MEPLFIFMDLEAAHGNTFFGDIIEIAAQVDPRRLPYEVFQTLVNTKQTLTYFALHVCKLTKENLKGWPYFPEAFESFMEWVIKSTKKCSNKYSKAFYPVLVAHGGFDNDFMMIQSNLGRNEISLDVLSQNNLGFADTYLLARKLRDEGIKELQGCQLSIEKLFQTYFPKESLKGQHRALPDVKFMIKIFLETPLKYRFDEISIAAFKERNDQYNSRNTSKQETKLLNDNLPKGMAKVTHAMTLHRLLRNGLTFQRLQSTFESSVSYLDFYDQMKQIGIERKASKSIASRLSSMGLSCRGEVDNSDGRVCSDVIDEEDVSVDIESNSSLVKGQIIRSDSGYESIGKSSSGCDLFYAMFVEEFFIRRKKYEYTFGSFTIAEIRQLDDEICKQFNSLYYTDTREGRLDGSNIDKCNEKDDGKDDWEDEVSQNCVEFSLPIDRGLLAKSIPIGMTMNDFNGKELPLKVPLFTHFDDENVLKSRPEGGIPSYTGKSGRKHRRRVIRKNLAAVKDKNVNSVLNNSSCFTVKRETEHIFASLDAIMYA